jgi:hypothetical protein
MYLADFFGEFAEEEFYRKQSTNGLYFQPIFFVKSPRAYIQRRGSILAWIIILSVYGADTIAKVK